MPHKLLVSSAAMPHLRLVHTVVESPAYLASAKAEAMTAEEMKAVVDLIAANPKAGDLIVGSGGCRKVRVAGKSHGNSGGYRVVTFYAGRRAPTFLIAVLSKASRQNFSAAEVKAMAAVARVLVDSLRPLALD